MGYVITEEEGEVKGERGEGRWRGERVEERGERGSVKHTDYTHFFLCRKQ